MCTWSQFPSEQKKREQSIISDMLFWSLPHTLQHKQTNEWICTAAILTRRHSYKYAASAVVIFLDIKHT